MKRQILVVTRLDLRNFHLKVHGIDQRFRLLLSGACAIADEVVVLTISGSDPAGVQDTDAESQIRSLWGLHVRVITSHRESRPFANPWIVEQIKQAVFFRHALNARGYDTAANKSLLRKLTESRPAAVIAHRIEIMDLIDRVLPASVPIVFDMDDIEHVAFARKHQHPQSFRERLFTKIADWSIRRTEKRLIARANRTLVCSRHDREILVELAGRAFQDRICIVPNAQRIQDFMPPPPNQQIVFVGALTFPPNAEAVDFFVKHCWSRVKAAVPTASLLVIGKDPQVASSHATPPDGVRFAGFVQDLDVAYRQARLVICPILQGGGTRVKLIEAACFGKPVVSTTVGAEGLGFVHRSHALLADSAETFADACIEVLKDQALASRLAGNIHAYARENFSWDASRAGLENLIRGAL